MNTVNEEKIREEMDDRLLRLQLQFLVRRDTFCQIHVIKQQEIVSQAALHIVFPDSLTQQHRRISL